VFKAELRESDYDIVLLVFKSSESERCKEDFLFGSLCSNLADAKGFKYIIPVKSAKVPILKLQHLNGLKVDL
jgi:DNA polymerase sigma